jgi:DNA-binding transcriptional regulator YiaG
MPNIGSLLKEEISRISRRESRKAIEVLQKFSAIHRRDIAALKRQVAELERELKRVGRSSRGVAAAKPESTPGKPMRFVAKGLRSTRLRLGLSAAQLGRLLGVSEQSVYNWESKVATPRRDKLPAIARLRTMGKREAAELVEAASKNR